jgi:osmotically-inducible protein OsmY
LRKPLTTARPTSKTEERRPPINSPKNAGDRDLARKIRKSIVDAKNLSTYARNVKVIARGGTVRLKGPVRNDEEKSAIAAKAVEIAGAANVKDEITVKSRTEN